MSHDLSTRPQPMNNDIATTQTFCDVNFTPFKLTNIILSVSLAFKIQEIDFVHDENSNCHR